MTATNSDAKDGGSDTLDHMLYGIREDIAAARVAVMQVLVYHLQNAEEHEDTISADEFLHSVADITRAQAGLVELEGVLSSRFGMELPAEVAKDLEDAKKMLSDLLAVLARGTKDANGAIQGFHPGKSFLDLCARRVAPVLSACSTSIGSVFMQLSEDEKAEDLDKTSKIALEIGKIGRVINMVATNASIEAARVGDAGKGFTVIADEVKTLSTRVSSLSVSLTDRLS